MRTCTVAIVLCWSAGLAGVMAQGVVNFSNLPSVYGDGIERRICAPEIGPVTDTTWSAQLLENGYPVGAPQPFLGTILPGVWEFANRTLNVPGGTPTTLTVRILDGRAQVLGISEAFTYTPPSAPTAAPSEYLMWNFRVWPNYCIVPEPGMWVLGLLGVGVLTGCRRRGSVRA